MVHAQEGGPRDRDGPGRPLSPEAKRQEGHRQKCRNDRKQSPSDVVRACPAKNLALNPRSQRAVHMGRMTFRRKLVDRHSPQAAPGLDDLERLPRIPGRRRARQAIEIDRADGADQNGRDQKRPPACAAACELCFSSRFCPISPLRIRGRAASSRPGRSQGRESAILEKLARQQSLELRVVSSCCVSSLSGNRLRYSIGGRLS